MSKEDETPREPPSAPTRGEAARRLGDVMDRCLMTASRLPWQVWTALAIAVLVATYPRGGSRQSVLGIPLDNRLSIWVAQLAILGVLALIMFLSWFLIRAILRYVEQDRWPRRAGSLEIEELGRAQVQLDQDADALSRATDGVRILKRDLELARETIVFLRGELERGSRESRDDDDQSEPKARSE